MEYYYIMLLSGGNNVIDYIIIHEDSVKEKKRQGFPVIEHKYTYTEAQEKIFELYMTGGISGKITVE